MRILKAYPAGAFPSTNAAWIDDAIAKARAAKLTGVELLFGMGTARWRSDVLPRSSFVTSTFDPLEYAVSAAHGAGLTITAWFSLGVMPRDPSWRSRFIAAHPIWDVKYYLSSQENWLNFDNADARALCVQIVSEIAEYKPDFVGCDYIRYNGNLPTSDSRFTAGAITQTVRDMAAAVHAMGGKISAHVLAGWGSHTGARQLWNTVWTSEDLLDVYAPMSYVDWQGVGSHTWQQWYDHLFTDWALSVHKDKIAPTFSFTNEADKTVKTADQLRAQIEYVKAAGYGNHSFYYGYHSINDSHIALLAELAPAPPWGDLMTIIERLEAIKSELQARVANLASESAAIQAQIAEIDAAIVELRAIDAQLDAAADVIVK